jgi:hypothetical protein
MFSGKIEGHYTRIEPGTHAERGADPSLGSEGMSAHIK